MMEIIRLLGMVICMLGAVCGLAGIFLALSGFLEGGGDSEREVR